MFKQYKCKYKNLSNLIEITVYIYKDVYAVIHHILFVGGKNINVHLDRND